jgi:hypothetical protein
VVSESSILQYRIKAVQDLLSGSAQRAGTPAEIEAAERRLGITLPWDVRALVSVFDGSDNSTPVENGFVTFSPMSAWQRAGDVDDLEVADDLRHVILFADYSLDCWWYAFEVNAPLSAARVYCVTGVPQRDGLVAETLSEFLQAIIEDGPNLYPAA